jgi:hypothetical protein
MPKTQYFTAASLDGFIADSGNSLDWLFQAEAAAKAESASGDLFLEFYARVGALAMGATTYEWLLGHEKLLDKPGSWPYSGLRCWSSATASCPPCLMPTSASCRATCVPCTSRCWLRQTGAISGWSAAAILSASSPTMAC